jgi:hypothetical protein
MLRVICVNTGTKYDEWYVDNLKHMVDTYSGLKYDEFAVIRDDVYQDAYGTFNKLLMFDYFRDGQNIYFDLDVIIKGDCNWFLRKDFTLCYSWWKNGRDLEKPLNSSIMSWQGDCSHIHETMVRNKDKYFQEYTRGMDKFIYEKIRGWKLYTTKFWSYKFNQNEHPLPVCLFNQRYQEMIKDGWWQKYFLERP